MLFFTFSTVNKINVLTLVMCIGADFCAILILE